MPDLPDFPTDIPEMGDFPETPENNGIENVSENSIEKGEDLEGTIDETDKKIVEESDKSLESGNEYLDSLTEQAESLGIDPEVLQKAMVIKGDINNINEQILDEEKRAKKDIHDEANPGEKEEKPEIIDAEWRWVDEPLNEDTREFIHIEDDSWNTENFTNDERNNFYRFVNNMAADPRGQNILRALESVSAEEEDRAKEFIKLLLRIAIKVAAKTASAVAHNIAKTAKDNKDGTTQVIFGTIGDLIDSSEGFAQSALTGNEKPNLGQDFGNFFRRGIRG
jgi:hypothetical protein